MKYPFYTAYTDDQRSCWCIAVLFIYSPYTTSRRCQ